MNSSEIKYTYQKIKICKEIKRIVPKKRVTVNGGKLNSKNKYYNSRRNWYLKNRQKILLNVKKLTKQ